MNQPLPLSAIRRTIKPTDYQLMTLASATLPLPAIDISKIPINMQGQLGICGAEGGAFLKEVNELQMGNLVFLSPAYLWKKIKLVDGLPLTVGTSFASVFSALKTNGISDFGSVNEDTTQTIEQYSNTTNISMEAEEEAKARKISAYAYLDDPTEAQIKTLIDIFKVVGINMEVGENMYTDIHGNSSWKESDILPLRIPKVISGGHFVAIYKYAPFPLPNNPNNTRYWWRNWWSKAWGANGDGYFDSNYISYIKEVGRCLSLPDKYPFDINLSYGMTSPDVKELQKLLNKDSRTQIASSGAGSVGHETYYFGMLTKIAVQNFQVLHNLPVTGYVGLMTRSIINGL